MEIKKEELLISNTHKLIISYTQHDENNYTVQHTQRPTVMRNISLTALTFCSRAVTSCSDFTTLNLRSLMSLLASPENQTIKVLIKPLYGTLITP